MPNTPHVSVIIIFLNAERFLEEAIESVFAQTDTRWELWLVDDGSSDGSTILALTWANRHPAKVRYLEHPQHQNRGMAASRNLGLHQATGEYIAFLDADDVWLPHKLEQQVALMEAQPEAAMVYGLSEYWSNWTQIPTAANWECAPALGVPANTLIKPPGLLAPFFLRQEAAIPGPSNILLRRTALNVIGEFEEDFHAIHDLYEDQAFYAKVCLKVPVFASNACWDRYRQHPDSSCAVVQKAGQEVTARLFFLSWLAKYLTDQGVRDVEIWRALRRQVWSYKHPHLNRWLGLGQHVIKHGPERLRWLPRRLLPAPVRRWLWARWRRQEYVPPVGWVRFGSLQRLTPIGRDFGYERGTPIDRYYIEQFVAANAGDIKGHVLEIGDDTYTRQFGGGRVTQSDVLHVRPGERGVTIVADLSEGDGLPSTTFDCAIGTQTLQFVYDVRAAIATLSRILKPGGVLLATAPGISPISRYDMERWGQYWSFTTLTFQRLFEEVFPEANVAIEAHGNVLAATGFLYGLAAQDLHPKDLEYRDRDYEVLITIRAVKP